MNLYSELTMMQDETESTLSEVESRFTLKDGIIQNLGKFEGESLATPYFYECYLNGGESIFEINESERESLKIDSNWTHVVIMESDSGFVTLEYCESLAEAEDIESESMSEW